MTASSRPTIAVDIDDVLALSVEKFLEWSNERFGTNLTIESYTEDWSELWNMSQTDTSLRVDQMYREGIPGKYSHIEEAVEVLSKLKPDFELIVATARRKTEHIQTKKWIKKHYPSVFRDVHFAGIWDEVTENSATKTKARLCKELGVDYLIDDQVKHCIGAESVGVTTLLYGDYPWNNKQDLPESIKRVADWREVAVYFENVTRQ